MNVASKRYLPVGMQPLKMMVITFLIKTIQINAAYIYAYMSYLVMVDGFVGSIMRLAVHAVPYRADREI